MTAQASTTQQQQITGYAMMKGWTVAEHFVERAVSGSMPLVDRPEGKRLLSTIGKGDVIISAKLDRAFRSAARRVGGVGGAEGTRRRPAHDRPWR